MYNCCCDIGDDILSLFGEDATQQPPAHLFTKTIVCPFTYSAHSVLTAFKRNVYSHHGNTWVDSVGVHIQEDIVDSENLNMQYQLPLANTVGGPENAIATFERWGQKANSSLVSGDEMVAEQGATLPVDPFTTTSKDQLTPLNSLAPKTSNQQISQADVETNPTFQALMNSDLKDLLVKKQEAHCKLECILHVKVRSSGCRKTPLSKLILVLPLDQHPLAEEALKRDKAIALKITTAKTECQQKICIHMIQEQKQNDPGP
ncbi:hypothetical protein K439DRAFT_1623963 [Ramaria rubella]|nr:hypothetical protein K439DRAFT_1623963 [Ramaria rubella]